jgi:sugar phosphate permease
VTQILSIIPSAYFLNSISTFVNLWFGKEEKGIATALCSFAITLGTIIALALSGLATVGMDKESVADCQQRTKYIMWLQNIFISTLSLFSLIFFRGKPQMPPTRASLQVEKPD